MSLLKILAAVAGGAAIGYVVAEGNDNEVKKKLVDERAKNSALEKKYREHLGELTEELQGHEDYFKHLISMYIVGVATAHADGFISTEEETAIDAFIIGLNKHNIPSKYVEIMDKCRATPPNVETTIQIVNDIVKSPNWGMLEMVVRIVMNADGVQHEKEQTFLSAFLAEVPA